MAHMESRRDLMHVPTPTPVLHALADYLLIPDRCYAVDPCCGTGAALRELAPKARRYGVELDSERAAEAGARFEKVLPCAVQNVRVSHNSFGLMLLNPPYDDSTEGRLESVFMDRCYQYLDYGGVLVLIVKEERVNLLGGTLRRHFDVHGHWRFPEGWYDGPHLDFQQTVLVATRRREPAVDRNPLTWARDHLRVGELETLPERLPGTLTVPVGHEPRLFISAELSPEELAAIVARSPIPRFPRIPSYLGAGRPPISLKQGHIAMTLASGLVNGVYGAGPTRHIAKGTVVRAVKVGFEEDETSGGNAALVKTTTDSFSIKIRALTAAGVIHEMQGGAAALPEEPEK